MKNNDKYPETKNKKQISNSPAIQNYIAIVDTLPTLGWAIWIIGGFTLYAYSYLTGQPATDELELLVPIFKTFK